jgi:hypothetical protein
LRSAGDLPRSCKGDTVGRRYHAPVPSSARSPTLDEPAFPPPPPDGVPPTEPAPGLGEQIGATRASGKRLIDAHLELARAEFADIADAAKRAAALIGIALAAAIFAALLVGVGTPLWLGEWIFGSIGWGILLGLLLLGAVALAAISLALRPSVDGRIGQSFVIAAVIGIVVGAIFGLDVTNRAWSGLADNVVSSWSPDSRPLFLAMLALAVIVGIIGLIVGLVSGMGVGAIGGVVAGAIGGAALGALTAAAPGPRVGAAIGVAAGLIAWIALMGSAMARGGLDTDKLKDRFWPSRTIEVTKETIEWARERMPLKRPS